jgi:BACON domain-containing protein
VEGPPRTPAALAQGAVSISNTGEGTLYWQANIDSSVAPWLSVNSIGGTISSAQSMQVIVNAGGAGLAPGNYSAQITLTATDNSGNQVQGSPQIVQVTLTILPACSLLVTPTSLLFTAINSQRNPPGQNIVLNTAGNCPQTVLWTASVDTSSQKWLTLSATSGTVNSQGSVIVVSVRSRHLLPGSYGGQIVISAVGKDGRAIQRSPISVFVTLTVTP